MLAEPPPEFHIDLTYKIKLTIKHNRSSCLEVFCKKGVLRNFTKFTGKHLCQSLFFNKVSDLRPATLLKSFWYRCFPVNFAKFPRTSFLQYTSGRLLLKKKEKQKNFIHRFSSAVLKDLSVYKDLRPLRPRLI